VIASRQHAKPLKYYIENSIISVLSYGSLYGIILKLEYIGRSEDCPYLSIDENQQKPLTQIILKLAIIDKHEDESLPTLKVGSEIVHKATMSRNGFYAEIRRQFKLVKDTIQLYEPICPTIIFWDIQRLPKETAKKTIFGKTVAKLKHTLFDSIRERIDTQPKGNYTDPLIDVIQWMDSIKFGVNVGILAMEMMDGYDTLHSSIVSNRSQEKTYISYAIYELIRLGSLGYVHGDSHMGNILIHPNVPYFDKTYVGRAMLIDFGRTKSTSEYISSMCEEILLGKFTDQALMFAVVGQLITPFAYQFYKPHIDIPLLQELIVARNTTINNNLQMQGYIENANKFIGKYNKTINNRLRSWKDTLLFKAAPLLSSRHTRRIHSPEMSASASASASMSNPMANRQRKTPKNPGSLQKSNSVPRTIRL
jgi:ABC1 atypical kinase-like domain